MKIPLIICEFEDHDVMFPDPQGVVQTAEQAFELMVTRYVSGKLASLSVNEQTEVIRQAKEGSKQLE